MATPGTLASRLSTTREALKESVAGFVGSHNTAVASTHSIIANPTRASPAPPRLSTVSAGRQVIRERSTPPAHPPRSWPKTAAVSTDATTISDREVVDNDHWSTTFGTSITPATNPARKPANPNSPRTNPARHPRMTEKVARTTKIQSRMFTSVRPRCRRCG